MVCLFIDFFCTFLLGASDTVPIFQFVFSVMARNEEKQFGRLNRLHLQKMKDGTAIFVRIVLAVYRRSTGKDRIYC